MYKSSFAHAEKESPAQQNGLRRDERRIEVHVTQGADGKRQVVLEDLSHGPGIGWYVQKTIRLDPQQVEALLRSLSCIRHGGSMPCPEAGKASGREATEARILKIESLLKS